MGLFPRFSKLYYGNKVLNMMGIDTAKIKEQIQDAVKDYATNVVSNVSSDSINSKIENIQIDENLTPGEAQERSEKVEALQQVFESMGDNYVETHEGTSEEDKPYQNIVEAIGENPEAWGQILDNGNVSVETLNNMAEAASEGNPPPATDMIRLVYGASSGAVSSFTEKYADPQPEGEENENNGTQTQTENENTQPSNNDLTKKRSDMAESILPESNNSGSTYQME